MVEIDNETKKPILKKFKEERDKILQSLVENAKTDKFNSMRNPA